MAALTPQMIEGIYHLKRTLNVPVAFYFRVNSMYAFLLLGQRAVFALYAVSAVYTLIKLPDGIVLGTDVTSPLAYSHR
ncbi:hypothetical protein FACS1894187_12230 [Synergistales bacterium]|nr:hypothetical protein FACS1894187_12230 [Synergistales bacterium]